jgi:DNA helicase-2/ATP-dependent DNA helicase PcrA
VLREKLGRPIGYVGTIHSFCYSLIRKFIGELTIVLDDEREALIAAIIVEQRYKGTMKAVQEAIQKRDRTNLVYCAYKRSLAENGMIDFDGILETGLDVITKFKDELKYTDLLVDEYQDVSDKFDEIFRELPCKRKFFVGDTRQAIYSFLGGNVKNIIEATKEGSAVYDLTKCYRCAREICGAANNLIPGLTGTENEIESANGTSGKVVAVSSKDVNTDVRAMVNQIRNLQEHTQSCTIAVLLRTNSLVKEYTAHLEGYGVNVIKNKIVQQPIDWEVVRTLLAVLANPDNDLLMAKYMRLTRPKQADQIITEAKLVMQSINAVSMKFQHGMTARGAVSMMTPKCSGNSAEKLNAALATLKNDASINELLLSLSEVQEELTGCGVRVCTMHTAKGGEWDAVFIAGMEQGLLPHGRGEVDEERRLCYVGVTRARTNLFLTWCESRENSFTHRSESRQPSQFLTEMGLL